ncbi:MAG: methylenetetrahydrofolate--tRNA-(uracil(54)-C(5))-methyltransferase (FADH(2)-oxidizing) TrmFO [Desulfurivibrionaceae bacterium]
MAEKRPVIKIAGGGLAGCEAAWQAAQRGCRVEIYEMKPEKFSPAHSSPDLAELVCSNSLRSADPCSAVGLLKDEMRLLGSLVIEAAEITRVPAGKALAVDRQLFARHITEKIDNHPDIEIKRGEIKELSEIGGDLKILATGPLTSSPLADSLRQLTGRDSLYFYDAIAPIVTADSLDYSIVYRASRYDEDGSGDYLNCPLSREEYEEFIQALSQADQVSAHSFEDEKYFEGCLPVEVMLARGRDTLRYGPLKPVGLPDPRTGRDPWAVVQLRMEDREGSHYNMVGFQTRLTYPEQKRVFRRIPGLEKAEFVRLGSIHRNTFICGPEVLSPSLQVKKMPDLLLAGQLTGVEGYVESTAMGLLAGINGAGLARGVDPFVPPPATALGALVNHLTRTDPDRFQPSNINFSLFPPLKTGGSKKVPKGQRKALRAARARELIREIIDHESVNQE